MKIARFIFVTGSTVFIILISTVARLEAEGEQFWIRVGGVATSTNIDLVADPGIYPSLAGYGMEIDVGVELAKKLRFGVGALGRAPRSFDNPESGSVSVFSLAEYFKVPSRDFRLGICGSVGWMWFFGSPGMRGELVPVTGALISPDTRGVRGSAPMFRGELFVVHNPIHWLGIRVSAGYLVSEVKELSDTDGRVIITPSGESVSADLDTWLITISFDLSTAINDSELW